LKDTFSRSRSSSASSRGRSKSTGYRRKPKSKNWGGIIIDESLVNWRGVPPLLPSAPPDYSLSKEQDRVTGEDIRRTVTYDKQAVGNKEEREDSFMNRSNRRSRLDESVRPKTGPKYEQQKRLEHDQHICPEYMHAPWHDADHCPFVPRRLSDYNKDYYPYRRIDFQNWKSTRLGDKHPWAYSPRTQNLYDRELYDINIPMPPNKDDDEQNGGWGNEFSSDEDYEDSGKKQNMEGGENDTAGQTFLPSAPGNDDRRKERKDRNREDRQSREEVKTADDVSMELRLLRVFDKKIQSLETLMSNSHLGRPLSSKITDTETVPAPLLSANKPYNKESFNAWIRRVPSLLKHINITYTKTSNIIEYLKQFAAHVVCTAPYLSEGEYNSLLFTTLDYRSKSKVLSFLNDRQLWNMKSQDFHDLLISCLGQGLNYNSRKANFHSYSPGADQSVTTLAGFISKVKILGESCVASPLDIYFKILSNLPGHCQSELRAAVKNARCFDADYLPSPAEILDILSESGASLAYHFSKGKGRAMTNISMIDAEEDIGNAQHSKNTGKKSNGKNERNVHQNQQKMPEYKPFTAMQNDYRPTTFKGYSTSEPTKEKYQGGRYELFDPNQPPPSGNIQGGENRRFANRSRATCPNCLGYGHTLQQCVFKPLDCKLCGSLGHIGPACTIYRGQTPVEKACRSCMSHGEKLHHETSKCLRNPHTGKHEGGSKN
jgi:hypothetical protein